MEIIKFILNPLFYLPIIYALVGYVIYRVIKRLITALFNQSRKTKVRNVKRYNTLLQITIDCVKILVVTLVILSILTVYGVDVQAALAGLGIVSVLIGLAAQDLLKDVIVGFSIVLEDQFSVGDIVNIDDFKGEVLHIGIKSTRVKKYDGTILIIANRNIDKVINCTASLSLAIVDIPISYESDVDYVEKVLTNLFKKLSKSIDNLKGEIEIWGIDQFDDSSLVVRVAVKTLPEKHYAVQRQLRKEIKKEFDHSGIKIPYPQLEVHNGK